MDIPELIGGIILTLIGVIVVEYIIHYLKERSLRNRIITSLLLEVVDNIKTLNINIARLLPPDNDPFLPLKTSAYDRYRLYIDAKLFKIIGLEREGYLSSSYYHINDINRQINIKGYRVAGDIDCYFDIAKEKLEEFLTSISSFSKINKLLGENVVSEIENLLNED